MHTVQALGDSASMVPPLRLRDKALPGEHAHHAVRRAPLPPEKPDALIDLPLGGTLGDEGLDKIPMHATAGAVRKGQRHRKLRRKLVDKVA